MVHSMMKNIQLKMLIMLHFVLMTSIEVKQILILSRARCMKVWQSAGIIGKAYIFCYAQDGVYLYPIEPVTSGYRNG